MANRPVRVLQVRLGSPVLCTNTCSSPCRRARSGPACGILGHSIHKRFLLVRCHWATPGRQLKYPSPRQKATLRFVIGASLSQSGRITWPRMPGHGWLCGRGEEESGQQQNTTTTNPQAAEEPRQLLSVVSLSSTYPSIHPSFHPRYDLNV